MTPWQDSVEKNRDALERLAEHGKTQLAEDVRELLAEADAEAV